jgi:hypothetical protein
MASLACGASAAHADMSGLSDGAFTRLNPFGITSNDRARAFAPFLICERC